MTGSWSLGVTVGIPIAATAFVVLLIVATLLLRWYTANRNNFDAGVARGFAVAAIIAALLVVAGTAWALYPWSSDYHRWQPKTGVVTDVSSRLLPGDKSVEQKFVVQFTDGQQYGCNDTRCALVKVGDALTLTCKRAWQFTGRDGWDCNYVGRRARS